MRDDKVLTMVATRSLQPKKAENQHKQTPVQPAVQLVSVPGYMLRLQRQYGNRFVQQTMALLHHDKRQEKRLPHVSYSQVERKAPLSLVQCSVSSDYSTIVSKLSYGLFDWAITDKEVTQVLEILANLSSTDRKDTLNKMKSDDILQRLLSRMSDQHKTNYKLLFVEASNVQVPPHPSLAATAASLGGDTLTMDSYRKYQDKSRKWFFASTNTLMGRAAKPVQFKDWADWDAMHWQSKQVIADLAGVDASRLGRSSGDLSSLQAAYATWPAPKFAVFQSGTSATNTCNVFLGDALFMDGRPQTKDGKFFSAADVYGGEGSFTRIDAQTLTQGDVAAWGGHVEIVTSVNHANDEFCSRGGYREPMGGDKCNRKINDAKLRYFRVP